MNDSEFKTITSQFSHMRYMPLDGLKCLCYFDKKTTWTPLIIAGIADSFDVMSDKRENLVKFQKVMNGEIVGEMRDVVSITHDVDPTDDIIQAECKVMNRKVETLMEIDVGNQHVFAHEHRFMKLVNEYDVVFTHLGFDTIAANKQHAHLCFARIAHLLKVDGVLVASTRHYSSFTDAVDLFRNAGFGGTQHVEGEGDIISFVATKRSA